MKTKNKSVSHCLASCFLVVCLCSVSSVSFGKIVDTVLVRPTSAPAINSEIYKRIGKNLFGARVVILHDHSIPNAEMKSSSDRTDSYRPWGPNYSAVSYSPVVVKSNKQFEPAADMIKNGKFLNSSVSTAVNTVNLPSQFVGSHPAYYNTENKSPVYDSHISTAIFPFANVPGTNLSKDTSLLHFNSPLTQKVQSFNSAPGQLLKPANAVAGSKDQLLRMAALRSQLFTQSIGNNFKGLGSQTFSSSLSVENDFLYQPVIGVLTGSKFQNVVGVRGSLTAFGIPLNINVSNNQAAFNGVNPLNSSLFKFGFSPSMFSGLLKSDLQQYADLKNSVFHGFNFTQYVQQTVTEKVSSLQRDGAAMKNSPLSGYLNDPAQLQSLMKLPDTQIKQRLETAVSDKYAADAKLPNANDSTLRAERVMNYQKADSMAAVISAVKVGLKQNGLSPEKLLLAENYSTGKTSSSFNSSELANGMYTKNPANTLQSLFGSVKDLRIGSFGNQVPGATGTDAKLMNGANLSVRLGSYPLTVGYGTLNDIASIKDEGYNSSIYSYPKNITYVGADMKRSGFGDVKVAVVSSFNGNFNNLQYAAPTLPGNTVAFTVTKGLKFDNVGNFTVDVSKSGTLYSSSFQPGSEAIIEKKAGANYNLNSNLFQSFAVGFTHNLSVPKLGTSDNIYFNYAGLGYQNPANNGYSGSTMKFGGNLKKKLYKNKLTLDFRTDYRSMPLSYTTNDTWRNYQVQFDTRYQVSPKFNLSLKYIDAATSKNMAGVSSSVYSSSKLEFSANDSYKIGKYLSVSQLNVSNQSLSNIYESSSQSSLVNVSYMQSLVLKNSSLTGTLFYNKELSQFKIIGDLLTSDLTYQYQVAKNLQLGSGLTYLNNAAIAKQVGVKQSLQVTAGKHFDISAAVDLRKNLITPQYADLYASTRGEISLKYYFKID